MLRNKTYDKLYKEDKALESMGKVKTFAIGILITLLGIYLTFTGCLREEWWLDLIRRILSVLLTTIGLFSIYLFFLFRAIKKSYKE